MATPARKVRDKSRYIFMPQPSAAPYCPCCTYIGFIFDARKLSGIHLVLYSYFNFVIIKIYCQITDSIKVFLYTWQFSHRGSRSERVLKMQLDSIKRSRIQNAFFPKKPLNTVRAKITISSIGDQFSI